MCSVSVIVAAYNSTRTIQRAIDSALGQSMSDLEILIVDDCSTDGTADLVRSLYGAEPRVKLLSCARNGGPSRARNLALDAASGEWVAVLDADDLWLPDRLETLLSRREVADFIADGIVSYDAIAERQTGPFFLVDIAGALDFGRFISPKTKADLGNLKPILRRSFLNRHGLRYDEHLRYAEDFVLYARLLCLRARACILPYAGYVYTSPIGRLTRTTSPDTRTTPSIEPFLNELSELGRRFSTTLTGEEKRQLERRIRHFRAEVKARPFALAYRRRDFVAMFGLLVKNPVLVVRSTIDYFQSSAKIKKILSELE
ncbi:glycosyltransferase family 2 protein [Ancylobacter amanitiformis]|uniref:Succinoglycan biosynthesis protein ExoO n=1 Tax=Ancylobacter amanitiformis TaxID=217069 RepID=A0ABU0LRV2_9HYPH|nr:glycosyltransferase family A protein [Ancylobacter amanitiformis]MDQ0511442.1 succinoglycan biosynthesis protein ExoO [Ancylobacter amanitiformis]